MNENSNLPTVEPRGSRHHAFQSAAIWVLVILAVVFFSWLSPTAAKAIEITEDNVGRKIEEANTAEEHQALQKYFMSKADEATQQIRLHEKLLQSYRRRPKTDVFAVGMQSHCLKLIETWRETQEIYQHVAEIHGEWAMEAA